MALHSLYCADVPLRNCTLTQAGALRDRFYSTEARIYPHYPNDMIKVINVIQSYTP